MGKHITHVALYQCVPERFVADVHVSPCLSAPDGACPHYIRFLANSQIFLDGIADSVWIMLFLSSFDYL